MTKTEQSVQRIKITLAYDGTLFHGWAAQTNLRTVQDEVQKALSLICQTPILVTVAGRTDAGVHAQGQVCHADILAEIFTQRGLETPKDFIRRLNKILPEDIRIADVEGVSQDFDARFSALRRHYQYRVSTDFRGADPLYRGFVAHFPGEVSVEDLNNAAVQLLGLHDFAAYCRPRAGATTIRELQEFYWVDTSDMYGTDTYTAHVVADAFCWSMVRSIVGACLAVASGKREKGFTGEMLAQDSRSDKVPVAPARGLSLVHVDYPADEALAQRAESTRAKRG